MLSGLYRRQRQVASLGAHNLTYRQIVPDSQFEIVLPQDGMSLHQQPLVLTLLLMPAFPNTAPIVYLRPLCTHPWINSQGQVVGHDRLANWSQHASLGRVLKEVQTEFKIRPPLRASPDGHPLPLGLSSSSHTRTHSSSVASPSPYGQAGTDASLSSPGATKQVVSMAYTENIFPTLDTKSLEEINRLLGDETSLEDYLMTLTRVRDMKNVHHDLVNGNGEIAERILSNEEEVNDLKRRIKALQGLQASHRQTLDELLLAQKQELSRFGGDQITSTLRDLVSTSDSMSEMSAQSYLDGKLTEDEFIRSFKESRQLYHLRSAKLEHTQNDPSILSPP
ncbi:hypothetical protein BSLG_006988 [Batrachochytrium salamandrivorans]|nr:hypothetical protein BSLG_006988 [Batrachochytrium salamandrivorans]